MTSQPPAFLLPSYHWGKGPLLFYAYGYFRGISGHRKGLPLDFPSFRAPAEFSALFEHSQGTEIQKKDTQKATRRFVGFVNHQAGAFLLPGKFK